MTKSYTKEPINFAYEHSKFEVVSDPDEEIGYYPGARIKAEEMQYTNAFDQGMIIRNIKNGQEYQLDGCKWRKL